jgi:hypothetical protein
VGLLGWVILCIVVLTFLKVYVFLPLRIRKENWISAAPEFISVDASDHRVPASTRAFFLDVACQLEPVGFNPAIWLFIPDAHKGVSAYLAIFENFAEKAEAAAMVTIAEIPPSTRIVGYVVEIETSFFGGTTMITNNDSSASTYPSLPWRQVYRFADMADLGLLYRVHQHLSATPGASPKEAPPAHSDILHSLQESLDREYAGYIRTGHLELDEDGRKYHQTIKGAYRAVWSQLWPLKPILRWRYRGVARRVLRELGLPSRYETVNYVAEYKGVEEEIETAELVEE